MTAETWSTPWHIIGRGKAGWHAQAPNVRGTGGTLEGYAREAQEGALVYDNDASPWDAVADLAIKGPMPDPSLPPFGVKRFLEASTLATILPGLGGAFHTIGAAALAGITSLDSVGLGIYEGLVRAIPGVRIGHVKAGKVVWEP